MNLLDAMLDFAYMLAGGDDFWAGVWFSAELVVLFWAGSWIFRWLDVRWKRVRQYFAPAKKPAKVQEEPRPSPASESLACLGNVLLLGVILVVLFVLLGLFFPNLTPW